MLVNRLQALREGRNFSREQLADQSGTTRQTIWLIETKGLNPSVEVGICIARVFGLAVEDIFDSVEAAR